MLWYITASSASPTGGLGFATVTNLEAEKLCYPDGPLARSVDGTGSLELNAVLSR